MQADSIILSRSMLKKSFFIRQCFSIVVQTICKVPNLTKNSIKCSIQNLARRNNTMYKQHTNTVTKEGIQT